MSPAPEAIFFLSDGYFDDSVVSEITQVNARRAQFMCLVFDEQYLTDASGLAAPEKEGSQRMRRIADANRGDCKIVTAKDLAK